MPPSKHHPHATGAGRIRARTTPGEWQIQRSSPCLRPTHTPTTHSRNEVFTNFPASRYATEINHRSLSVYLLIVSVMARSLSRNRTILIEGLENGQKVPPHSSEPDTRSLSCRDPNKAQCTRNAG
jgi:hypothetical protein